MQNRTINPTELVRDVRKGEGDADLMRKYGVTANGLQVLLNKLVKMRRLSREEVAARAKVDSRRSKVNKINAREFAEDVQLGLDDENLMFKYNLSQEQLSKVLRKMIDSGLLSIDELYNRLLLADSLIIDAVDDAQSAIDELD